MKTGLVSVTFRELQPPEIIRLAKEAGLHGIEWGGDYHCPPGKIDTTRKIASLMKESGLTTLSYGSYYKVKAESDFNLVLNNAILLETGNIRVWAGDKGSAETDENERQHIVSDTQRIADMARVHNIDISFEYHSHTLTDTIDSTIRLLEEINRDNVYTYWQAPADSNPDDNIRDIKKLVDIKKLKNLHIQEWSNNERQPLASVEDKWKKYISAASPSDPALLLEFVKDDSSEQFLDDTRILKKLI